MLDRPATDLIKNENVSPTNQRTIDMLDTPATEPTEIEMDAMEEMKEGHLYTVVDGEIKEIERDPEDVLKKVRILPEAFEAATEIQRTLRKQLGGYKPDISLVVSALVIAQANDVEASCKAVKKQYAEMTNKISMY